MQQKIKNIIEAGITSYDKDNDGKISLSEFISIVTPVFDKANEDFARFWFRGLDLDLQGKLSFDILTNHFQMMHDNWNDIENNKPPVDLLKIYYRGMDRDRNAQVSLEEMRNFLASSDETMNTHLAAVKLRKMDKDNSGTISFYEYCLSFGHEIPKRTDPYEGKGPSTCCLLI